MYIQFCDISEGINTYLGATGGTISAPHYVQLEIQLSTLQRLVTDRSIVIEELRSLDQVTKTLVRRATLSSLVK